MRRRRGIWIIGLMAAAFGAAAVGVHAGSAAPIRAAAGTSVVDKTYSCKVQRQHYVDLYASVTLPPVQNQPQPGILALTTGVRSHEQNGALVTVSQVSVGATKNSLRIDTKSCQRVKHQIPLKPKGLPSSPTKVNPTLFGRDSERCVTSGRVLFRLRVKTKDHIPTQALLAVRDDNAKRRPIAFYRWSPQTVYVYAGQNCSSNG